jgi:hypothetical protein
MTLPDRKGHNPAERVIFNQIHFPMLEWLCLIGVEQRSSYPQTRQSLVAAITWDLKTGCLMWRRSTGQPPAKGNSPGLSSDVIEGLWHWLLIWDLLHPRALTRTEWQLQGLFVQRRKCACHLIYIGIVVVVRHVNLWCNHTIVLISSKASDHYVGSVPDYWTIRAQDVQVEVITWYMISCKCGLILISSVSINVVLAWTR